MLQAVSYLSGNNTNLVLLGFADTEFLQIKGKNLHQQKDNSLKPK